MSVIASDQVTLLDITDAYSIMLTSEAYVFPGDSTGAMIGSTCSTQVVGYLGSEKINTVHVGSVYCPDGIEVSITNNDTESPTVTFTTTTSITSDCEATISVTVDNTVTISKKFSFAVALQGNDGTLSWTPVMTSNAVRNGSTFIRNSNTYEWDCKIYSEESFSDGCYVIAKPKMVEVNDEYKIFAMFGLSKNVKVNTETAWKTINYAMHFNATCIYAVICENGQMIKQVQLTSKDSLTDSTIGKVECDGENINFYVDGELKYSTPRSDKSPLYLDSNIHHPNNGLVNLTFGPCGAKGKDGNDGVDGTLSWIPNMSSNITRNGSSFINNKSGNWAEQVYSSEGFASGCYASAKPLVTTVCPISKINIMFGLNEDPTKDASYASLDYAMWLIYGKIEIYENGVCVANHVSLNVTLTENTVLKIEYDGENVNYYADTRLLRSIKRTKTTPLYLDSSFTSGGSGLKDLVFGPCGAKGKDGNDGKGIQSTIVTYQASSDGINVPTGTWTTTIPTTNGEQPYLWTRVIITYTDGTTSTSYSIGATPELAESKLALKLDKNTLKSSIEAIADVITINAKGGLNLSGNLLSLHSDNLDISADGKITKCKYISATSGKIGGCLISPNSLDTVLVQSLSPYTIKNIVSLAGGGLEITSVVKFVDDDGAAIDDHFKMASLTAAVNVVSPDVFIYRRSVDLNIYTEDDGRYGSTFGIKTKYINEDDYGPGIAYQLIMSGKNNDFLHYYQHIINGNIQINTATLVPGEIGGEFHICDTPINLYTSVKKNISKLTAAITTNKNATAIYLANASGVNTSGWCADNGSGKAFFYLDGMLQTESLNFKNFYGSVASCAVNRTPANDVSFSWDGTYLRIYIDNTIIASYDWPNVSWV